MKQRKNRARRSCALSGILAALVLLLPGIVPVRAANTDSTVYVKKHVCMVYDDSGSMNFDPRWSYASYAAQTFAGLLNDTDTLTIYRMKQGALEVDLGKGADRAAEVTKIREGTMNPTGATPSSSIDSAKKILIDQGLKSDAELAGQKSSGAEQYWLVVTTDGVFDDEKISDGASKEAQEKQIQTELLGHLERAIDGYSSLHLVYFGIGGEKKGKPKQTAVQFETMLSSRDSEIAAKAKALSELPNFTAVYATSPQRIVETMQGLSTQIAGRYEVSEGVTVSGNQVTLDISAETSPIRNIAVLAQSTDAELVEATAQDGTKLAVGKKTRLEYPKSSNLKNIKGDSKGGCTALVQVDSEEETRIPPGTVTLTFSQPVSQKDLSLMYEPAIYLSAIIEQQGPDGNWTELPEGKEAAAGAKTRVTYQICEMGTGRELDATKLFGKTEAVITVNGERVEPGQAVELPEGSSLVTVDLSMMDGGYRLSKSRTLDGVRVILAGDVNVTSSGPLTIKCKDLAANTDRAIEFTVTYQGAPADEKVMADCKVDSPNLKGETTVNGNIVRFVPKDTAGEGEYKVALTYQGEVRAEETVTATIEAADYEYQSSGPLAISCLELENNTDRAIEFTVTYNGAAPDEKAMADFTVEHPTLKGEVTTTGNVIRFVPQDTVGEGEYEVTLMRRDETAYQEKVTTSVKADELTASSSGPIALTCHELEENTEKYIEFTVTYGGQPADEAMLGRLTLKTDPELKGEIAAEPGKIRWTPRGKAEEGTYAVSLGLNDSVLVTEQVTVSLDISYTAEASAPLSLMDNEIEGSGAAVYFTVTAHTEKEDRPITAEEAELFTAKVTSGSAASGDASDTGADGASDADETKADSGKEAETDGAAAQGGHLSTKQTVQEGVVALAIQPDSEAGDYTVALMFGEEALAHTSVSILEHDVVYTVEAYSPDPNLVDRIFPERRNAQIAYVLTGDGKPCSAERLEALLVSSIRFTGDPENGILPIRAEVGSYNGQPAILAGPDSSKKWFLPRLIYRMRAAWNGVKLGEWNVTLTVDLPAGSAATGTLMVTDIFFWRMFYRILPLVLLVIAGLILAFIYSNLRMMRLQPGTLEYYCLSRTGSRGANVEYMTIDTPNRSMKVRQGIFLRLTPRPQVIEDFHGKRFTAETLVPKKTALGVLRYGRAKVSWKDDGDIANYYWQQNALRAADDEGNLVVELGTFDASIDNNLSWVVIEEKSDNDSGGKLKKKKKKKNKKSKISKGGGGIHVKAEADEEESSLAFAHVPGGRRCTMLGVGEFLIHRTYTGENEIDRRYPETIEIWCHRPPVKSARDADKGQAEAQKLGAVKEKKSKYKAKKL